MAIKIVDSNYMDCFTIQTTQKEDVESLKGFIEEHNKPKEMFGIFYRMQYWNGYDWPPAGTTMFSAQEIESNLLKALASLTKDYEAYHKICIVKFSVVDSSNWNILNVKRVINFEDLLK